MAQAPLAHTALEPDALSPSEEPNVAVAWRLLSSARTLLVLATLLALLLALAAALPQRPSAAELAHWLPFASAEAATDLGLTDVLVAWPTLLLVLLIALNAAGILVARATGRRHGASSAPRGPFVAVAVADVPEPIEQLRPRIPMALRTHGVRTFGRKGLHREGAALALLGLAALAIGLVVARSSALDARLLVAPGSGALSEAVVRDGDLYLGRALPFGLLCDRPDPQDPQRAFGCRLAERGAREATPLSLAPGYTTSAGDFALRPALETLRGASDTEAFDLVLTRQTATGSVVERLRLESGKTVALRASGERLTAFSGPDGPLVLVERDGRAPELYAPPTSALPGPAPSDLAVEGSPATAGPSIRIEAYPATTLMVDASTTPEGPLVVGGTLIFVLGLLLMGLVPHLEVELVPTTSGARLTAWSTNRPARPRELVAQLLASHEAVSRSAVVATREEAVP